MASESLKVLKCVYSRNGCEKKFRTETERKQHLKRCIYQEDECPQCENFVIRKYLGKHTEEDCDYRPVQCDFCKGEFFFKDLQEHRLVCINRPVECEYCKECFQQCQLNYHKESVCNMRPMVRESIRESFHVPRESKFEKNTERLRNFDPHISLIFENLRQLRDHFIQLKEENCKLRSEIAEIKRENLNIREDYQNISRMCEELNKDFPKLAQGMTCLTTEVKNLIDRNKERDDSMKCQGIAIKAIQDSLSQERQTLNECLMKQKSFVVEMLSRIDKVENKVKNEKEDNLYLCVGCEVYVDSKNLTDIRCEIGEQLFNDKLSQDKLTLITPGIDMDEVAIDKDLGVQTINGQDYRCEITQWKYSSGDRGIYLSLKPILTDQPWPPPDVDRAMWCLFDPYNSNVYYYRVLEGWLDTSASTGLMYKVFGWFDILQDKYESIKEKSLKKKLQSAFMIFKNV